MKIGVIRRCHDHTRRRSSSAITIDYNRLPFRPTLGGTRRASMVSAAVDREGAPLALEDPFIGGSFTSQTTTRRRSEDPPLSSRASPGAVKQTADDVTPELCNSKLFSVVILMIAVVGLTFAFAMAVKYMLR